MNHLKRLSITTFTLAFLGSTAVAETLTGEQVKSLMTAKRIDWVTPDGKTGGSARYKNNGSATATITKPNKLKDSGTWRIKGNEFCTTWKVIRDGREGCSTVRTTTQDGVFRMDTVFIRPK